MLRIQKMKNIPFMALSFAALTLISGSATLAGGHCFSKSGFTTMEEDGYLWVLRPNEEKSEKHITLVGAGPGLMSIKAVSRQIAIEYLASKPGFQVEYDDGTLWILKPGEEKSEKHITLVGAGPMRTTVKALDKKSAIECLAAKPGFEVEYDDGYLWVLKPGEAKSEKHITLVGAGPLRTTIKALETSAALHYLAQKWGFDVELDDEGRLWVFRSEGPKEKSEKHVTHVGAGPLNTTIKALDSETVVKYLASKG